MSERRDIVDRTRSERREDAHLSQTADPDCKPRERPVCVPCEPEIVCRTVCEPVHRTKVQQEEVVCEPVQKEKIARPKEYEKSSHLECEKEICCKEVGSSSQCKEWKD
ncbi:hypothetical protein GEMRC1_008301 [Eukaryota sp. GEM-RC1]